MEYLTAEQAAALTEEQLAERLKQAEAEEQQFRDKLRAQAILATRTLPKDSRGVPCLIVPIDDPDAWKTFMFHSQRLRDRGDTVGRETYGAAAHAAEMGYWKDA